MPKSPSHKFSDHRGTIAVQIALMLVAILGIVALGTEITFLILKHRQLKASRPELAEELAVMAADLKILPTRELAFSCMAGRIDTPVMRSVVTTLAQSMRLGTPLSQAMRTVAAAMRDEALIKLEERANSLPALLTVPMMLFILPTLFLIVGGPAALKAIDLFMR